VLGGSFKRIQFTPDLVPSDLIGTRIYRADRHSFETELGPVFCNFLLADEINRAPAKVQSALLEVMQERQVTIGPDTFRSPHPFLVLATQNPIESEGTYPLPEAQVDRFMFKVVVDYPSENEEVAVVYRTLTGMPEIEQVLSPERLVQAQEATQEVFVDRAVNEYAVALVAATRDPGKYGLDEISPYIEFGASPRGSINLIHGGRALALLRGRGFVLPDDVRALALDVLRHRLVLTYEALAEGVGPDSLLEQVVDAVPVPEVTLTRTEVA
jgi:MoxR-like ATPase